MYFSSRSLVRTFLISMSAGLLLSFGTLPASDGSESPDEQAIAESIRSDLEDAERIDRDEINVTAADGLVTLSGTVNSLLDKRLATKVAKQTRGVAAVLNQMIVQQSDRSDRAIREDVMKVLRLNQSVPQPRIAAQIERGRVSLAGQVGSLAEKRIAETAVAGVRGVVDVDNRLTVDVPSRRDDEELREEISGLLVHSVYLDDAEIDVDVKNHVAMLSGVVGSAEAKDHAIRIAEVWGVTEVNADELNVDPDQLDPLKRRQRYAEVDDPGMTEAIERAYRNDPVVFSQAENLDVEVRNAVVYLRGHVARQRIQQRAEALAQAVVGVRRVVNEIEVNYPETPPNAATIIADVQAALVRSPYLERHNLRVHCQDGHVSLYGIVDSQLEQDVAGWLAGGIPGVVHVNNSLAIDRAGSTKSDEQIKKDLERKLKYRLVNAANDIRVTIEDGVAVLRGEVDTWRQWQAAMDLALEAGAHHPHNLINVRLHPPHGGSGIYVPQ